MTHIGTPLINIPTQSANFLRVVGIGASAGGLDALTQLLPTLQAGANTVYIIAQHMARDSRIDLVLQLLKRYSSLPVVEANCSDLLVADKIFLIPPGMTGVLQQGHIKLSPVADNQLFSPSVDALLHSIAHETYGSGVGIILSGAGNDGLSGCRSLKAYGGTVIAQNLESAQYAGMPSAIIETGIADHVLAPTHIAQFLDGNPLAKKLYRPDTQSSRPQQNNQKANLTLPAEDREFFKQLLQRIFTVTAGDFSGYKEETLLRRLYRRMKILKITSLANYVIYTHHHVDELHQLHHEFLISVSSFFRDKESFMALNPHITELIKEKALGESLRIWVPGCASGEECYSWAIILHEILGDSSTGINTHIIGSDLNDSAIAIANKGIYSPAALDDIDTEIARLYFDHAGQQLTVKPTLRRLCEFRVEDVMRARPTEKMDVISCRNLLIYLNSEWQNRLIKQFYDSLQPNGLLFLGQSETIDLIGNSLFLPLDHYHRVYRRKNNMNKQ